MSFLNNPYIAVIIFIVFLVGFFVYLDIEGSFENGFLHFGPGDDRENTTTFMGIKLDSWSKVITLYIMCFFTGVLTSYYNETVKETMFKEIWNADQKVLTYTQAGTYTVSIIDPLIMHALNILALLETLTIQFQFILPLVVGQYMLDLSYLLDVLAKKEFAS
jgi:hypothetical protein